MAKTESVSENEHLVLVLIRKYLSEHEGDIPYPGSLIGDTPFSTNHLSNILRSLARKGYLERTDGRLSLTDIATQYFARLSERGKSVHPFSILPVSIQINGEVKAGASESEVLVSYGNHSNKFIPVPEVRSDRKVYALKVVGDSMVHENVFEGDYVIVEEYDYKKGEEPRPDEMAVLMYVPLYVVFDKLKAPIDNADFLGPTLKYCKQIDDSNPKYYRLSWKSGFDTKEESPYIIKAAQIRPIGKVIGIYRTLTSMKKRGL